MKTKLYCKHCQKTYTVKMEDIRFMLSNDPQHIKRGHGHYYYEDGCFFKALNRLKTAA